VAEEAICCQRMEIRVSAIAIPTVTAAVFTIVDEGNGLTSLSEPSASISLCHLGKLKSTQKQMTPSGMAVKL
jgi:hypothetical protein